MQTAPPDDAPAVAAAGEAAGAAPGTEPNPYVGPRPFAAEHAHLFFGREAESNDIISLAISHPVLLLYAASGAGKTSLLNAQVIPTLIRQGCQVIGPARVTESVPTGARKDAGNRFVRAVLRSLSVAHADTLDAAVAELSADEASPGSAAGKPPQILVFDQFEEIFTSAPERWQERVEFFDQVGALLEARRRLRVVFAMREEYIARMERYAPLLPERLRTRFRLEKLREAAAVRAVKLPVEATRRRYAEGAAETLVRKLLEVSAPDESRETRVDEFVEPVQLQLVCRMLWDVLKPEATLIDATSVQDYGDVEQALAGHYDRTLQSVCGAHGFGETRLRRWIERILITPAKTRAIAFKEPDTTAGLPNPVVEDLEQSYLLAAEVRGNDTWYELAHDRFIVPIVRSNQAWDEKLRRREATGFELEQRAKQWALQSRPRRLLLVGQEAVIAAQWLKSDAAREFAPSETVAQFVEKSAGERRLHQVLGIVAVGILAVFLGAGVTYYALSGAHQATRQAQSGKWTAYGTVAGNLAAQPGKEFDALVWGVQAVGEASLTNRRPPAEAMRGLRAAVRAVGPGVWLRGGGGSVISGSISRNGEKAAVVESDTIRVWNTATGRQVLRFAADSGYSWVSARFVTPAVLVAWEQIIRNATTSNQLPATRYRVLSGAEPGAVRALDARLSGGSSLAVTDTHAVVFGRTRGAEVGGLQSFGARRELLPAASKGWSRAYVSPTGDYVVALRDSVLEVWDVRRRVRVVREPDRSGIPTIMFSPDGRHGIIFRSLNSGELWSFPPVARPGVGARGSPERPRRVADLRTEPLLQNAGFSADGTRIYMLGYTAGSYRLEVIDLAGNPVGRPLELPESNPPALVRGAVTQISARGSARSAVILRDAGSGASLGQREVQGEVQYVEPDSSLRRLLVLRANDAMVLPLRGADGDLDKGDPKTLLRTACAQARGQPEYAQVRRICERVRLVRPPPGRNR